MTTHPPKVLVTKIGLDGHDRGSRVVAAFLRDAGMEVVYTPPWQDIPAVVKLALEADVDVIGVSSLATDHLIVPKLMQALGAAGLQDIAVIVGGIVPDADEAVLPLAAETDRHTFRLLLLGALNWTQHWFREGGRSSPRSIARSFLRLLREAQKT